MASFDKTIPDIYDTHLVPMLFEPYAKDIVQRIPKKASNILEIAAGTGAVTRTMDEKLPMNVKITATDISPDMLNRASSKSTKHKIDWMVADAMKLPFDDHTFDAVVCQFGAMFFTDKKQAFSEIHRVLKPGGMFIFNVWDDLSNNELSNAVFNAVGKVYPVNTPGFLSQLPFAYNDISIIEKDLMNAGFKNTDFVTIDTKSKAESAKVLAVAYLQGTPLRHEIETLSPIDKATENIAKELSDNLGDGIIEGKTQAHVISAQT